MGSKRYVLTYIKDYSKIGTMIAGDVVWVRRCKGWGFEYTKNMHEAEPVGVRAKKRFLETHGKTARSFEVEGWTKRSLR